MATRTNRLADLVPCPDCLGMVNPSNPASHQCTPGAPAADPIPVPEVPTVENQLPYTWSVKHGLRGYEELIVLRGATIAATLAEGQQVIASLDKLKASLALPSAPGPGVQAPAAVAEDQGTPLCPDCQTPTTWKTWVAKADRPAGGAWKCVPCDKLLPRRKSA